MSHNVLPELQGMLVPIDTLVQHPRNPRVGDTEGIRTSLRYFGQVRPIVVQKATRFIVAGNHTKMAAEAEGWTEIAALVLEMSDETALEYLIADNRWSDRARNDDAALIAILTELEEAGRLIPAIGYEHADVETLMSALDAANAAGLVRGGPDDTDEPGSKLAIVDVTIADPRHQPERGDVWSLSGGHVLVVDSVFEGAANWMQYLADDPSKLFVPYPTPGITLSERAKRREVVMVQPDVYMAGHVLDKHESVFGEGTVAKMQHLDPVAVGGDEEA